MHVFIDTNILLNFLHFTKDELDALNNVFASHEHGSATVHLTQQVVDEFRRNRETKIADALKRFNDTKRVIQFPSFMKGYGEYEEIRKLSIDLQIQAASICAKAENDISNQTLSADLLIGEIFDSSEIIPSTPEYFQAANMRAALGNPPGKKNSLGDAMNWSILIETVPDAEDLHIISEDGDYFSSLNENVAHPFLAAEWNERKGSSLRVYRTLSNFMREHFDGVAFSFDKEKEGLIDRLGVCGSFASTHEVISKLNTYGYFALTEVEKILDAANNNSQFGSIVTDYDISDLLNRIAVPRKLELTNSDFISIVDKVIKEQLERDTD